MTNLKTMHRNAMELATLADIASAKGDSAQSKTLLLEAYQLEMESAWIANRRNIKEPTRSILFKSAAYLAIQCELYREAERLVAAALAGEPPDEIIDELRFMLEEVSFDRHLDVKGMTLEQADVQMVLTGSEVAPGMADSREVVGRINAFKALACRTAESEAKLPYRVHGESPFNFKLYVSIPRAASFAISLRVATDLTQNVFSFSDSTKVVDTLLRRISAYDNHETEKLKELIPDGRYLNNFISLANKLGPDGVNIKTVGFTFKNHEEELRLNLVRPLPRNIGSIENIEVNEETVRAVGRVTLINARNGDKTIIKLTTLDEHVWSLKTKDHTTLLKLGMYITSRQLIHVEGKKKGKRGLIIHEIQEFDPGAH